MRLSTTIQVVNRRLLYHNQFQIISCHRKQRYRNYLQLQQICRDLVKDSNPQSSDFPESGFKVESYWSNPYKIKKKKVNKMTIGKYFTRKRIQYWSKGGSWFVFLKKCKSRNCGLLSFTKSRQNFEVFFLEKNEGNDK